MPKAPGSNQELEPKLTSKETRFGQNEEIVEAILEGEVTNVGKIEEVYPEAFIPSHVNEVDIVNVNQGLHKNVNNILGVKIQSGSGEELICIFKPADGESSKLKEEEGLPPDFEFYPRECAGYLVSDHFELDIVPPTVIREIDGKIGSLQLFLSPEYYKNYSQGTSEEMKRIKEGDDWGRIAILDWLLINNDRHSQNMMTDKQGEGILVAIDHGIILDSSFYEFHVVFGPSGLLTEEKKEPRVVDIPENLVSLIERGLEEKEKLDKQLEEISSIDNSEIERMWLRAEQTVSSGKYLSRKNFEEIFGYRWNEYDRYEENVS